MIIVNCALQQDEIVKIVEGIQVEGKNLFKFNSKQGLQLKFDSEHPDANEAAALIKKEIKATPVGKALFFSVAAQ